MEATGGLEPPCEVLQTPAWPLGYVALVDLTVQNAESLLLFRPGAMKCEIAKMAVVTSGARFWLS